tara:strand:+ start:507 stop:1220 length:714 start_codon:yes stop_codon:yes gene_type:complete
LSKSKLESKSSIRKATTRPDNRRGMTKGQIREERRQRSNSKRKLKRNLIMSGVIIIAVIFIASLVVSPGLVSEDDQMNGKGKGVNEGGHIPLDPDDGREHIEPDNYSNFNYSVKPATSGPHWYSPVTPVDVPAPARWGVYESNLPDEILIHNLEHGGIGLHYNCPEGCDELVTQLKDLVPRNPSFYIVSPYNNMERKIAITAWRHHLFLDEFNKEEILKFIDEYIDRSPESVPSNPW